MPKYLYIGQGPVSYGTNKIKHGDVIEMPSVPHRMRNIFTLVEDESPARGRKRKVVELTPEPDQIDEFLNPLPTEEDAANTEAVEKIENP